MASNIASTDPPMTLGERQKLKQLCIRFCIPPHEFVFTPSVGDVMSKEELCDFVDGLLKELVHQYPTIVSPQPGAWKLVRANADLDLERWDPRSLELDMPLFITSNKKNSSPISFSPTSTHNGSWTWGDGIMCIRFPDQGASVLEGHYHVLVILRCQTKVKVSSKKKEIVETNHTIIIPTTYTVKDVLSVIQCSSVHGVFIEPHEDNIRGSILSASELGWKHGTTLKLKMW